MAGKVVIAKDVEEKLIQLYDLLYQEGYFSYKENAYAYVEKLRTFIKNIPDKPRRQLKKKNRFGQFFRKHIANDRTTWFVAFDVEKDKYLITYITNNFDPEYRKFLRAIKV